ncbi:hypothetical protein NPIL_645711 [Nephila pilipes]|uniref:Uncharacterized protein n=1 Tax=Nephila pilipes TaxID=299642 RepID=A0A8X6P1F6_NEPPI|nr:hypothetical protein NPIL_645711 [Nephila pilipes]
MSPEEETHNQHSLKLDPRSISVHLLLRKLFQQIIGNKYNFEFNSTLLPTKYSTLISYSLDLLSIVTGRKVFHSCEILVPQPLPCLDNLSESEYGGQITFPVESVDKGPQFFFQSEFNGLVINLSLS